MSRAGFRVISAIAEPIGAYIRTGDWRATVAGAAIGAIAGLLSYFVLPLLALPGALLGGIIGAGVAAAIFKAPIKVDTSWRPATIGDLHAALIYEDKILRRCAIVLDDCVYYARAGEERALAEEVLTAFQQGRSPDVPDQRYIPFAALRSLVLEKHKSIGLPVITQLGFDDNGTTSWAELVSQTFQERDDWLAVLQRQSQRSVSRKEVPMGLFEATWGSATISILAIALTVGLSLLASHWIANPPRQRGDRPDELVALLTGIGPFYLALVGALLSCLPLGWMAWRIVQRPKKIIVTFS